MQKIKRICGLILLTGVFFTYCFAFASTPAAEDKKDESKGRKVVSKVNGREIYEDQLTPQVQAALRKFKKNRHKDSSGLVKHLQQKALDELIGRELIYQAGLDLSIPDIEERINDSIKAMKSRHQSEEGFEASLKAKNLTVSGLRESRKRDIYIDEYLKRKGILNPEVPEAAIKEFYDKNKDNFKRKERIRVSHILIKADEGAKPEEKEQARKKAEKIRQEIMEGKDFSEMATGHSGCATSAKNGGDLGYIEREYMPPEFDKCAFSLKKGEVSDIVQTKFGFHIIKVVDISPEGIAPYVEVKDFIGNYLKQGIARKKMEAHIKELRETAKIEIFLN